MWGRRERGRNTRLTRLLSARISRGGSVSGGAGLGDDRLLAKKLEREPGGRRGEAFRALPGGLWARCRTPKCSERLFGGSSFAPISPPVTPGPRGLQHFYIPHVHVSCVGLIQPFSARHHCLAPCCLTAFLSQHGSSCTPADSPTAQTQAH